MVWTWGCGRMYTTGCGRLSTTISTETIRSQTMGPAAKRRNQERKEREEEKAKGEKFEVERWKYVPPEDNPVVPYIYFTSPW